jgi:Mg2+ and Co2+ transporter CorA
VNVADNLRLETNKALFFNGATETVKFISEDGTTLRGYAGSGHKITINTTGGKLHGTWTSENTVTSSDMRLKQEIMPLYKSLAKLNDRQRPAEVVEAMTETQIKQDAEEVVRKLQPVSYYMVKDTNEAKNMHFGFIAQEVEKIFPSLVKDVDENGMKGIIYNDLIAVITMAVQQQMEKVDIISEDVRDLQERMLALESSQERVAALEREVFKLREMLAGRNDVPADSAVVQAIESLGQKYNDTKIATSEAVAVEQIHI